jgi:hypothetical protein
MSYLRKNIEIVRMISVFAIFGFLAVYLFFQNNVGIFTVKKIMPQYAADFSNDAVLVGAAHNIFVGKVIRQVGNEERGIGPETQYEVQVIDNIKGNLQGTVVVDQQGGYKDGSLYIISDDYPLTRQTKDAYLLKLGYTYLLATRYNDKKDWYTLNSYPTANKVLSQDALVGETQLKSISEADSRVQALKTAYQHEILLDADVRHNNAQNSYRPLILSGE